MGERCRLYMTRGQNTRHHAPSAEFPTLRVLTRTDWIHPDATGEFDKQSQLANSANALGNNFLAPDAALQGAWLPLKKWKEIKRKEGRDVSSSRRTSEQSGSRRRAMFPPSLIYICATLPGMRTPPNAGVPRSTGSKSNPVKSISNPNDASTHALQNQKMWGIDNARQKCPQRTCVQPPVPASAEQWKELHSRLFYSGTRAGWCCACESACARWQVQLWGGPGWWAALFRSPAYGMTASICPSAHCGFVLLPFH